MCCLSRSHESPAPNNTRRGRVAAEPSPPGAAAGADDPAQRADHAAAAAAEVEAPEDPDGEGAN